MADVFTEPLRIVARKPKRTRAGVVVDERSLEVEPTGGGFWSRGLTIDGRELTDQELDLLAEDYPGELYEAALEATHGEA